MTLNYLFDKVLKPMLIDHPMINDVGFGDLEKRANDREMTFPFSWVVLRNVRRRDNVFDFNLSFVFADVVNHDESNIIEIQSDMIGIAADIAGKISDHLEIEEFDESFTLDPFIQRFTELTAGVVLETSITVRGPLAGCEDC